MSKNKNPSDKNKSIRYRDSGSGQFISASDAKNKPKNTWQKEEVQSKTYRNRPVVENDGPKPRRDKR